MDDPRVDELLAQLERGELTTGEYLRRFQYMLDTAGIRARRESGEQFQLERIAVTARKVIAL